VRTHASLKAASAVLVAVAVGGCGRSNVVNPSFAMTTDQARAELREMSGSPRAPERPIVVIGGLFDPLSIAVGTLAAELRAVMPEDAPIIAIGMAGTQTMDDARQRVIDRVERSFPVTPGDTTREVDVVGFSLGGVVARDAAIPRSGEKSLRVKRLFTIASPHAGCVAANFPTFDEQIIAIRANSTFLNTINARPESLSAFRIYAYVRLGDDIVGPALAAPPGRVAWWVPNMPLSGAHGNANTDPRIIADIARRLRGEEPITTEPPAPLPSRD
jgi:Palmitoyl protein thioesterase